MGKCFVSEITDFTPHSLNPCFGGFGWERTALHNAIIAEIIVLILVLVDLGGKVKYLFANQLLLMGLNPCFGGFGWESPYFNKIYNKNPKS